MRFVILTALSWSGLVAAPALAQSYRFVEIVSPNTSQYFIIRQEFFENLATAEPDRFRKVATGSDFGPHPIGNSIRLRRLSHYLVMPVCREVMLAKRIPIVVTRSRETIQCP